MKSYAFVGETAPAASQPQGFFARAPGFLGRTAMALGAVVAVALSAIVGGLTTPFHYVDALVVIAVAIVPAMAVLAFFFVQDHGVPPALVAGGVGKSLRLAVFGVFAVIVLPGNLVLYANQRFDSSPAVIETVPVTEAWIRTGKGGSRTYMAGVATSVVSPLGRFSYYGGQPIVVARNVWTTILPGRTRFVLREHRGFFGLPWFEPCPARLF